MKANSRKKWVRLEGATGEPRRASLSHSQTSYASPEKECFDGTLGLFIRFKAWVGFRNHGARN